MGTYSSSYINMEKHLSFKHKPDFGNLLKVFAGKKPDKPVLFEFFLNDALYGAFAGTPVVKGMSEMDVLRIRTRAYRNAGYDYFTMHGSSFAFISGRKQSGGMKSISLNEGGLITDWESFERYIWTDPEKADYSRFETLKDELADGMKFIAYGPGGVLENVIKITGYENLCYIVMDEPELAEEIFKCVGSRLVRYYEICGQYQSVGAMISNDDWGFNTQTMLSVSDMRKYVIPWHRKIVQAIHASGRLAMLHSCGNLDAVMDDVIDDIGYDAKHSYEDKIISVEDAYVKWGQRIAIIGGIDVDFICRSEPEKVYRRSADMLEKAASSWGGYALGSGNSIPGYVPVEGYLAMIAAVKW